MFFEGFLSALWNPLGNLESPGTPWNLLELLGSLWEPLGPLDPLEALEPCGGILQKTFKPSGGEQQVVQWKPSGVSPVDMVAELYHMSKEKQHEEQQAKLWKNYIIIFNIIFCCNIHY